MSRKESKGESTREHLDSIFNATFILSFVGEAIGQSSEMEPFSESAHSGAHIILERVRDDLERAGHALTDTIYGKPGCLKAQGVGARCASEVEGRVPN